MVLGVLSTANRPGLLNPLYRTTRLKAVCLSRTSGGDSLFSWMQRKHKVTTDPNLCYVPQVRGGKSGSLWVYFIFCTGSSKLLLSAPSFLCQTPHCFALPPLTQPAAVTKSHQSPLPHGFHGVWVRNVTSGGHLTERSRMKNPYKGKWPEDLNLPLPCYGLGRWTTCCLFSCELEKKVKWNHKPLWLDSVLSSDYTQPTSFAKAPSAQNTKQELGYCCYLCYFCIHAHWQWRRSP